MSSPVNESGYFALAGFLYQFLACGVEAFEICGNLQKHSDAPDGLLILEWFGEDACVLPPDGGKPKLVQCKFTAGESTMTPAKVREILIAFRRSIRAQGLSPSEANYELVTNLSFSGDLEAWTTPENQASLEDLIRESSTSLVANVRELATIHRRLKYTPKANSQLRAAIDAQCSQFGVLEHETDSCVRQLVGFLFEKAANKIDRVVRRDDLDNALVGLKKPLRLLCRDSVELQCKNVEQFKAAETSGQRTVSRQVSVDISKAFLQYPLIVVHGDGGCGKSVAVSDAVLAGLMDSKSPPGFGVVIRAVDAVPERLLKTVERWRGNESQTADANFQTFFSRLRRACPENPLIVICIDAIDEKSGSARLPNSVQDFLRDLMTEAVSRFERMGVPEICIVLGCRRLAETTKLSRGFPLGHEFHEIKVNEFDDPELETLALQLADSIKNRIIGHLRIRQEAPIRSSGRAIQPVEPSTFEALRHPVIWRVFSGLNETDMHQCLDGNSDSLAAGYLKWFADKADIRVPNLGDECHQALRKIARHFPPLTSHIGDKRSDWIAPCVEIFGHDELHAKRLFEEAMSAGMLTDVEAGGHKWRWKHTWLCDYLRRDGE